LANLAEFAPSPLFSLQIIRNLHSISKHQPHKILNLQRHFGMPQLFDHQISNPMESPLHVQG
jgi:hypothetical protein